MAPELLKGFAAIALVVSARPAIAQDFDAKPIEKVSGFYVVQLVKFAPGGESRAYEIDDKYFLPAFKAAGLPAPIITHLQSGDWDTIYMFPLPGGYRDLEFETSPANASYMNALARIAGGAAAARALVSEWNGLVQRSQKMIGHQHWR